MLSSLPIPRRNVQASNGIGKYDLILKIVIDVVTNGTWKGLRILDKVDT